MWRNNIDYTVVLKRLIQYYNSLPEDLKRDILQWGILSTLEFAAETPSISSYYGMFFLKNTFLPEQNNKGAFISEITSLALKMSFIKIYQAIIAFATQHNGFKNLEMLSKYTDNQYVSTIYQNCMFLMNASLIGYNTNELMINLIVGTLILNSLTLYVKKYFEQQNLNENYENRELIMTPLLPHPSPK